VTDDIPQLQLQPVRHQSLHHPHPEPRDVDAQKAQRCADSCDLAGMEWEYWDAYDGVQNPIQPPAHHGGVPAMVKVTDHYMTRGEVACALSHISLWQKCVLDDQPLVVLEHDSVMVQPYAHHAVFNSICYLGSNEQVNQGWQVLPTPPHASEGPNYHFICRAHAYAIDPAVAKNMLAHVLKVRHQRTARHPAPRRHLPDPSDGRLCLQRLGGRYERYNNSWQAA
jgi:hypothetical protein